MCECAWRKSLSPAREPKAERVAEATEDTKGRAPLRLIASLPESVAGPMTELGTVPGHQKCLQGGGGGESVVKLSRAWQSRHGNRNTGGGVLPPALSRP